MASGSEADMACQLSQTASQKQNTMIGLNPCRMGMGSIGLQSPVRNSGGLPQRRPFRPAFGRPAALKGYFEFKKCNHEDAKTRRRELISSCFRVFVAKGLRVRRGR